ncbi:hypothetical protein AtNW77_Chr1g0025431 [Arabidopsis thaliana]|uniref:Late embryogenesis abundant protein (LEA) family protein n=3 Tax=Arabidopsis TaxID=3701 RepID=Q9SKA2_ARATH|nr:Late embryogenesis abundant protein (LEA) family protein [Arabidopsis thaliana]KAG7647233.1 hypothetical protein ISN45_At01g022910 [Arabidopsis thaliana x Arabidopsis arenosa]AAF18519.1 Similar to seed maturation protein PM27 [Arabidopsis thaliana]AAX23755.1 hypothetical protein At1g22600 [Arabidopsis thaliana]AAZ52683.1 hypothetical protein At1g22600 [Arabidopsis thaliana]AEE30259.1 Late embryogenesis abundant protein (LEA) family protein [Arabidopsis thaliana]|eukprot:NP_173674.1 Late embryogenesis abundant protein (LEA) family protein [Arabidopsis thaliana]
MTKLLALSLVLSALFTVGHCTGSEDDIIVRDGHRVVVVEYDRDGETNTRVLISPPGKEVDQKSRDEGEVFGNEKRETASSLPEEEEREHHATPGELICDAIGKCKHKLGTVLGRVKDRTASDLSDETPEMTVAREALEVEEKVSWKAREARGKVNERATKKAHRVQKVLEKVQIAVRGIGTVVATALGLTKIGSVVGIVGIAAAYGMCVWVTFVSGYVLASVLGEQQFGVVQSKMYPVYFKAVSVGILVGLLGHVIGRRRKVFTDAVDMWQSVNLLSSILMVEANASFVYTRATKAMFELIKAEKEDGRGFDTSDQSQSSESAGRTRGKKKVTEKTDEDVVKQRLTKLSERMRKLNAYSSRLNLLTLMSLTWHFVYLGYRLSLTC